MLCFRLWHQPSVSDTIWFFDASWTCCHQCLEAFGRLYSQLICQSVHSTTAPGCSTLERHIDRSCCGYRGRRGIAFTHTLWHFLLAISQGEAPEQVLDQQSSLFHLYPILQRAETTTTSVSACSRDGARPWESAAPWRGQSTASLIPSLIIQKANV